MRNLIVFIMAVIALTVSTSCSRIDKENRIVLKSDTDSLLVVHIPDAACRKCQKVIEGGLQNKSGVKQSILNLTTKEVSIVYDPQLISLEMLNATVNELSYQMPCKKM